MAFASGTADGFSIRGAALHHFTGATQAI